MTKKTINHHKVLYSQGKNDENYTPSYAIEPLLKYVPKDWVVWCPFDTENSNFVRLLEKNGNKVIHSHIRNGQDFYHYIPMEDYDCIISNPPFTNKRQIFERCLDLQKPFALLMTIVWLNDSTPKRIFIDRKRQLQLLLFDERIHFLDENGKDKGRPTFSSAFYCCDFLPNNLIQEKLNIRSFDEAQKRLI